MNLRFREMENGFQKIVFGVKKVEIGKVNDVFVVLISYDEDNEEVKEIIFNSKSEKEVNSFIDTLWGCLLNQDGYFDCTQEQNK